MEKSINSFLEFFHPFYLGPQTLDFLKEGSKNFLKALEDLPPKIENLEIFFDNFEIYFNFNPYYFDENSLEKFLQTYLFFQKLNIFGVSFKRNIKEENLIFWIQDFQKGKIYSNQWIKLFFFKEKNECFNLKFNILKALKEISLLISIKGKMEEKFRKGEIVSFIPLREKIQDLLKPISFLKETSLCLLPFLSKREEKEIALLIFLFVLLEPLNFSKEILEDILFSSLFYDLEEKKKWVPIIQSKNFSNGGFLSFLSACNHPSFLFSLFYLSHSYIKEYFSKKVPPHPAEILNKICNLEEISEELKNYFIKVLSLFPPSSPALTSDCEPCLVISKKYIALYFENKFLLKEGKGESYVPYEQFPFNPLYILLNMQME